MRKAQKRVDVGFVRGLAKAIAPRYSLVLLVQVVVGRKSSVEEIDEGRWDW
jgi:hypothetical protein